MGKEVWEYHRCNWGPRPGGGCKPPGEGVRHLILSGQNFAREIQIFKKFFRPSAETKNDNGDPYLVTTASRPRAVLSSANSEKPTARGTCSQGGRPWPGDL